MLCCKGVRFKEPWGCQTWWGTLWQRRLRPPQSPASPSAPGCRVWSRFLLRYFPVLANITWWSQPRTRTLDQLQDPWSVCMITFFFPICGLVNVNVSKLETSFLCRKLFMKCKSKTGRSTCSSTCHICLVQRPICWKPLNPPRPSITFSVSFHSPRQAKQQQCAIWTVRHPA